MGHDVFISFSSKDTDMAHRVYDGLVTRGVECWISSKDIPAGGNYQNAIVNALMAARVMVLIFSANANSSEEIPKELALAAQNRLAVMPLKIDDVKPTGGFIYNLATSQWVEIFPDFEKNLDNVTTTIKAIMEKSNKFALEVREAIEDDGVVGPTEQKYLEDMGFKMGLTLEQARIIIKDVVGGSTRSNIQECELEYLQVINEVLGDGNISSIERKLLTSKAKSLGISDARAQEFLEQEKAKLGISFDASASAAITSSHTVESVADEAAKKLRMPNRLAVNDEVPTSEPDENDLSSNSISDGLSWPEVGYNFLKAIKRKLDVSPLPFELVKISNDEDIDDNDAAYWQINKKHYFSVWFDPKSRRKGKANIYWGFYSDNMARDPDFRDACKEFENIQDALDDNGDFCLNNHVYEFVSDGYLGFETSERPTFEEMIQESYVSKIADQLFAFSQKIRPVIIKRIALID